MNRFVLIVISAFVLVLSACGGGSSNPPGNNPPPNNPPANSELTGKYNGKLTFGDLFADISFEINSTGNLTGTATITEPSSQPLVVGEKGAMTGTIKTTNSFSGEANVVIEWTNSGKYTITGAVIYSSVTRQLASSAITVKDANGAFVDTGLIVGTKE
jgi:hypothetical protein